MHHAKRRNAAPHLNDLFRTKAPQKPMQSLGFNIPVTRAEMFAHGGFVNGIAFILFVKRQANISEVTRLFIRVGMNPRQRGFRSEERRVGKECRTLGGEEKIKKKY